ncbi:MAG: hypothetical protein PHP62_00295 [Candidatus Moranbacteria bacterium]|nr:hypothetical protein [Candidatus Moranbacteria bacterium]
MEKKTYQLIGVVSCDGGSDSDPCREIKEEFEANTVTDAVEKAKAIIKPIHDEWSERFGYTMKATLREITPVWKTSFVEAQKAVEAVFAKPAVEAHVAEEFIEL